MKTKRRHELQTNTLADTLGHFIDAVRPYSSWIFLGVLAVGAVAVAIYVIDARNASDQGAAWARFFDARAQYDAELLRDIAAQGQGSDPALWAQQSVGDVELDRGVTLLFVDRDESEAALKRAKTAYRTVVDKAPAKSMLRQRALYGLAQSHESLGELDDAKKYYQQVADQWPNSMIGGEAESRLQALSDKSTIELYAFLSQYEPPPQSPLPNLPGADRDLFNMDLPEGPTSPFSSLTDKLESTTTSPGAEASENSTFAPVEGGASTDPAPAADSDESTDSGAPTTEAPAQPETAPASPAVEESGDAEQPAASDSP